MQTKSINELAKEVLDIEANSILRLKNNINVLFEKAIEILYACKGRVIITGMGKSGLIGKKIAATLSSTGTPSYFYIRLKVHTEILELLQGIRHRCYI